MDWNLFAWFMGTYALTYVPMYFAGRSNNGGVKGSLFMLDFLLTAIAYVCLWYALPSTLTSLFACVTLAFAAYGGSLVMNAYGYDPYGFYARRKAGKIL